jgi:pimeloyl-ACP methyl ester carboxylesterase
MREQSPTVSDTSKPTIFLLPGLGEDARIYRHIAPVLGHFARIVIVQYREVLLGLPSNCTPEAYLKRLVALYGIGSDDIVIGHSFGGWTAYLLHIHQGNPAAMLCSFSDRRRLRPLIRVAMPGKVALQFGLLKTPFVRGLQKRRYAKKDSLPEMLNVLDVFRRSTDRELYQIVHLIGSKVPVKEAMDVLRIQAKDDELVRRPREMHLLVDGDHFAPGTHPDRILDHLLPWVRSHARYVGNQIS